MREEQPMKCDLPIGALVPLRDSHSASGHCAMACSIINSAARYWLASTAWISVTRSAFVSISIMAFSPRKVSITSQMASSLPRSHRYTPEIVAQTTPVSCLYSRNLATRHSGHLSPALLASGHHVTTHGKARPRYRFQPRYRPTDCDGTRSRRRRRHRPWPVAGGGLEKTVAMLKPLGVKVYTVEGDLAERTQVQQLIRTVVDRHHASDILYNNAAIGSGSSPFTSTRRRTGIASSRSTCGRSSPCAMASCP